MKKILVGAVAAFAVILMGCGSVYAALQCTSQPSCASLGYSTSDTEGCESYVYCPFDTTYKACVKYSVEAAPTPDCTGYTLSSCPATASSCSACGTGTDILYKVDGCKTGYEVSDNTCVANSCSGYNYDSCPSNVKCASCQSGTGLKYKPNACATGYAVDASFCGRTGSDGWLLSYSASLMSTDIDTSIDTNIDTGTDIVDTAASLPSVNFPSINTDFVKECGKCMAKPCLASYTEANCSKSGAKKICYSGDTMKCLITTGCNGCTTGYDCSNLGGPSCSTSSTYNGSLCLKCAAGLETAE